MRNTTEKPLQKNVAAFYIWWILIEGISQEMLKKEFLERFVGCGLDEVNPTGIRYIDGYF